VRSVFVSYSADDASSAQELKETLSEHGYNAELADELLAPGDRASHGRAEMLEDASAVVLLIGRDPSPLIRNEWSQALLRSWNDDVSVPVVPVVLPDADVPSFLSDQAIVKLSGTAGAWEQVAAALDHPQRDAGEFAPTVSKLLDQRLGELHKTADALSDERSDSS
jgi:hypothetical protein